MTEIASNNIFRAVLSVDDIAVIIICSKTYSRHIAFFIFAIL